MILSLGAPAAVAELAEPGPFDTPEPSVLRLQDAIGRALVRNHEYLDLLSSIESAELDLEDARSTFRRQFYTRMDSDARVGSELGNTFRSGMSQKLESGQRWNVEFYNSEFGGDNLSELRFSYSLPIFDDPLDSGVLELRRAELDYEHRERLARVGSEELIAEVSRHYYQAVLARDGVKAAESEVRLTEALAHATRVRERNGRSSQLDVAAAELRVAQANQRWNSARAALVSADNRLKIMLGMGIDDPLVLDPDLPPVDEFGELDRDPEEVEALALANRAELLRLGEEMDLARRKLSTEPESRMPGLDVTLQYSRVGRGEGFSDSIELDENRFGIGLSMDMDVDGRRDITYRRIALFYKSKQRAYDRLAEDIRADVRRALMHRQESSSQLTLARSGEQLAEQRFRQADLLYRAGRSSTEGVLEREQALSEARKQERQARVDYLLSDLEVSRVSGTLAKDWAP
ncbi:MAG: TolC family protein [Chromatiales bacterium]|nr:MAG: TolC family protein [Chromatiales bacterium]